jgi:parallel beta-helix repeat protein
MAQLITSFREATVGQLPDGWTVDWTDADQSFEVENPSYARRGPHTVRHEASASAHRLLRWEDVGSAAAAEILAKVRTSEKTGTQNRLYLRTNGSSGDEDAYFVDLEASPSRLRMGKLSGGSSTNLGTHSIDWQDDTWHWIRFQADDVTFRARIWVDGTFEPDHWHIEENDTEHNAGGVGIGAFSQDGTRDWDYVAVGTDTDIAPNFLEIDRQRQIHARMHILRSDDETVVDVTDYLSFCEVELGDVSVIGTGNTGGDGVCRTARFRLHNTVGEDRFSPLDRGSDWNRFDNEYDPLLGSNRQAIFYAAAQSRGQPEPSFPEDYTILFHGLLGDQTRTGGHTVDVECRDLAKRLQDTFIEEDKTYARSAPELIEDVMQEIIDDNIEDDPPQIFLPELFDPALEVENYTTEWQSVWDALQDLAKQRGLWLGYRFDPVSRAYRLTLLEPPREKTGASADFVLTAHDDIYNQALDVTDRNVRNVCQVDFIARPSGERRSVTRENTDSIEQFGRRAMQIEEADTSVIKTDAQAERLADFAVHDLGELSSTNLIETPVELTMDNFFGLLVLDERISDEDDFYGVESVRHTFDFNQGRYRTAAECAGIVSGSHRRWIQMQTRPGAEGDPPERVWPVRANQVIVVATDNGTSEAGQRAADFLCDGIDDHIEINHAIELLSEDGGTVELLEGEYNIADEITVLPHVAFVGQGGSTIVRLVDDHDNDIILVGTPILDGENVAIRDMVIDGNKDNQSDGIQHGIFGRDGSWFETRISGVIVRDCTGCGIVALDAFQSQITDCMIIGCDADFGITPLEEDAGAIFLVNSSEVVVSANQVTGSGNMGISFVSCGAMSVSGNLVIGSPNGSGIQTVSSVSITISGNSVDENDLDGIRVHDNCEDILVNSNTCRQNNRHGISFFEDVVRCSATGNTSSSNGERGISITEAQRNTITSNTVIGNGTSGIALGIEAEKNTVANNHVTDNQRFGIELTSDASHNEIVANYIAGNSQQTHNQDDGIRVGSATSFNNIQTNTVRRGDASNQQRYGIRILSGADRTFVTNNDLFEAGVDGDLRDDGTDTRTTAGNRTTVTETDTSDFDINLLTAGGVTVSGNSERQEYRIEVTVPEQHRLVLRHIRYWLGASALRVRLRVDGDSANQFTTSSNQDDEANLDHTLTENATASEVNVELWVMYFNSSGSSVSLLTHDSAWARIGFSSL